MFDLRDTPTPWRIRSETDRGGEEKEETEGGGEWKGKGMIMITQCISGVEKESTAVLQSRPIYFRLLKCESARRVNEK